MIEQYLKKRGNMDILVAYQNELLAAVALLVVIYLYIIIKRKSTSTNTKDMEEANIPDDVVKTEEKPVLQEPKVSEPAPEEELQTDTLLDGNEEGDFGVNEAKPIEETTEAGTKAIQKRDVPPHAKIAKENFKEFAGQRILLAEDNIINQKVIQGLLAESGMEIIIANDGVEAVEILEKDDDFMMILMDAHMPRMDGFEATRKIRQNPKFDHIVIVALSGDTAADDIRKMNEAGMSEHLEKPLKMDALYDVLYAYAPVEKNSSKNTSYSQLDVEEGLEISGNDTEFYHEILREFVASYQDAHEIIEKLIKHNKLDNADQLLLDISGVAANIGAQKLHKTSVNLKTALKNNDNESSRLLFEFKEELLNLIKDIKKYLQASS